MKFSGFVVRVSSSGRISLPKQVSKLFGIQPSDNVIFSLMNNLLVIKKEELSCLITGSTKNVIEVLPGVPLSREGIDILMKELKTFET